VAEPGFAVLYTHLLLFKGARYFLQLPLTELVPSLHSVKMLSTGFLGVGLAAGLAAGIGMAAGLAAELATGPAEATLAGAAARAGVVAAAWVGVAWAGALCKYTIFLAPWLQLPTTLPGTLALLSTKVTLKSATPAALILDSI
jgi:hypothetical protein